MPFDATTQGAAVAVTLSNREMTLYAFGALLIFEVMAMFAMLIAFGESQPPEAVMKTHRVRVEEALALRERFHTKDLIARTVDQ